MASPADDPSAGLVTVPDLVGLPAYAAMDVARRCQLVVVGPSPDLPPNRRGMVLAQEPKPGSQLPRWGEVTIFTTPEGPGGAGVREPLRPFPDPPGLHAEREEPEAAPRA
jgi:hypothetical protein